MQRRIEPGPEPFFMTHIEEIDRTTLRQGAEVYGRACLRRAGAGIAQNDATSTGESDVSWRPLRIGFLSADFRAHPVSELAVGIYENLERTEFMVHAYGYGPHDDSPLRQRLGAAFDMFRDIDGLSFAEAADLMRRDRIDILVDMNGWTKFSRSGILAHAPAPVTATWLGFPGTLGVPGLAHYLISDEVVTPLDHAGDYAEQLALMPHSYQPSSRVAEMRAAPTRREAGLPEDAFVFCSFNQSVKITPSMFGLWCELLRRNSAAILWLGFQSETAQANLRREARAQGVGADRILFAPWRALPDHLARLPLADLALDTFPYGSHTTGSDMLWAGVPLVARLGETFAGRVSASVLHAAGLPELVARSDEEYLDLADALAKDPARCLALRKKLSAVRATAPLFDTRRFGRDLGRLFRAMWQNHLAGRHGPISLCPCDE
jgi:predicted O-linked N-acetylglucosamine transferase (SPINDLY family)